MRALRGISILTFVLTVLFLGGQASAQSIEGEVAVVYGKGEPRSVSSLPSGELRDRLQSLSPQAGGRALQSLQAFSFPQADLDTIKIDDAGNVFYADTIVPKADRFVAFQAPAPTTDVVSQESLDDAFKLHSRPGATNVVFIDFDGATISGTWWNGSVAEYDALPYNVEGSASTFSTLERTRIIDIWHRVAEDLAPYDIDVTTEEPAVFNSTTGHILVTHTVDGNGVDMPYNSGGGVAYVNVFGNPDYHTKASPALVYYDHLGSGGETYVAEASSHEFGHNLGLSHDGDTNATGSAATYYGGHGSGLVSWAPIMGNSYSKNVTEWSKGEYNGANQFQDDLAIIAAELGYLPDDHGNSAGSASPLSVDPTGLVASSNPETDPHNILPENKGVIGSASDVDVFTFAAGAGTIDLTIAPAWDAFYRATSRRGANLDIHAELRDLNGAQVAVSDPGNDTNANINATVSAGTYFLYITGVGNSVSPYSDYDSLGQYFIFGSVASSEVVFAAIGDYGDGSAAEQNVASLIDTWGVDFVIGAGDNRYGSISYDTAVGQDYCAYMSNAGSGTYCGGGSSPENAFFPVPGNHDYYDGGGINEYLAYFDLPGGGIETTNTSGSERFYDFVQGPVHFFGIDSDRALNSGTDMAAQQSWLQTQLAASTSPWQVVFLHHAPYSSANHGSYPALQWPYANWGVDAVFAGHDHVYERLETNGIPFFVNGLGGRSIYGFNTPLPNSQVRYNGNYGAMRVTANTDEMTFEFLNISGAVIDTHTVGEPVDQDGVIDRLIGNGNDDVEEELLSGVVYFDSTDIELGDDPAHNGSQTVGLRFLNLNIPQGATIDAATLQFVVDETGSGATDVEISAQAVDDAPAFANSAFDVTGRPQTAGAVSWSIPAWNSIGALQQSPDFSAVIQEVVNRQGWVASNAIAIIISGTGTRTAESFEGSAGLAPLLHVEYSLDTPDTTPPSITAPGDVMAEAIGQTTPVALGTPTVSDAVDPNPAVSNDAPALFPMGTTTVTWTATDASGNSASATQQVTVTDSTAPSITAPADASADATSQLTPVALGTATATDAIDPNPAVSNDAPAAFPVGTTTVTWTATDASGNSASATQQVTVTDAMAPTITAPVDVSVVASEPVVVALGSPTVSDLADPSPAVSNDAPALFPVGTTTVTWTAVDASGNSASASQEVTVTATPADVITLIDAVYKADRGEFKVRARSSEQPDVTLTLLGFGTMRFNKSKYEYKLKPVGNVIIPQTVTIVSSGGGTLTVAVVGAPEPPVPNVAPTAGFTSDVTYLTADFNDTSTDSDGSIVSWSWDFGDGNTSTAQNPSHNYALAGTYTVSLTVTDNDGAGDAAGGSVTVSEPPNAAPTASFTSSVTDLSANLTDTSTDNDGSIASWSWDFGDGNGSSARSPNHSYAAAGTYTVTLTVIDNDGAGDSASASVTVNEPQPPGPASNPSPADGASNADVNVNLGWSAGSQADSHSVYFGTSPTPPLVSGNQAGTSYDPGELNELTTYYWRVEETNAQGNTAGPIWSFTTRDATPADTIVITKAEWKASRSELKVEGTSTGAPAAVLTVEGFGQMTYYAGKNKYKFSLRPVTSNPGTVTVTSSLGGSQTKSVRQR